MATDNLVILLQELSERISRLDEQIGRLQDTADRIETVVRVNDDRISKVMEQLNMIEDAIVNDDRNNG